MQIASAELKLDIFNTVTLAEITPAEAILLHRIHGDDCLLAVRVDAVDKTRSGKGEKARLKDRYVKYSGDIETLFPGLAPSMPDTFEGIVEDYAKAPGVIKGERKQAAAAVDPLGTE